MNTFSKPSIYHFNDYKNFLQNFYRYEKKTKDFWSYEYWSRKLGLKNSSSLVKIVNGTRIPSKKVLVQLEKYFCFDEKESQYFRLLLLLFKYQNFISKEYADQIIKNLRNDILIFANTHNHSAYELRTDLALKYEF